MLTIISKHLILHSTKKKRSIFKYVLLTYSVRRAIVKSVWYFSSLPPTSLEKKKKEGFKCKLLFQCHYRRNITQKCNLLCIDKTKLKNASTYSHLETTELERKVHVAFRNSSVVCSSWLDGQSYCSADVKAPDVRKEVEQTEKNWVSAKLMDVVQNLGS